MEPKLLIGDDWSKDYHTICFMNPQTGGALASFDVPQSSTGFACVCAEREKLGYPPQDCCVGIETAHNLIVDYYLARNYHLFVIPPSVTKATQKRYRNSGAYTDQSAAFILADLLRTDRARFTPWRPHGELVVRMQAKVRLLKTLSQDIVRNSNRLQAVLLRVNPLPIDLFSKLTTEICLHFLIRYPTHQAIQALTLDDLRAFCAEQAYSHPQRVPKLYAHLQTQMPAPSQAVSLAYADYIRFLAQTLLALVQHRQLLLRELRQLFRQHPDHTIFASLPGAGKVLAPSLLVKFGDDRDRFPSPASVQGLAGTCPVTKRSGKRKWVHFRTACDKEFRWIATQFAMETLRESSWAIAYHSQLLQRGITGSHAIRCLANRWLAIIWKLWQTRQPYDESYHLKQRYQRHRPQHQV
jgi:transposase